MCVGALLFLMFLVVRGQDDVSSVYIYIVLLVIYIIALTHWF